MRLTIQQVLRDERGASLVGWVAITVMVFMLVVGIWTALYGGPGRTLKAGVEAQVARFANGFEGGLGTSGPTGNVPRFGQPSADAPVDLAGQISQSIDLSDAVTGAQAQIDRATGKYTVVMPDTDVPTTVQPMPDVLASVDPASGQITLVDPQRHAIATLNPLTGRGTFSQGALPGEATVAQSRQLDLAAAQAAGLVSITQGRMDQARAPLRSARLALGVPAFMGADRLANRTTASADQVANRASASAEQEENMMRLLRRLGGDTRGTNPVEYAAITGIALLIAGFLIVGITANRQRIGGTMANVLNNLIVSFESGGGGTIGDYDTWVNTGQPKVGNPQPHDVDVAPPDVDAPETPRSIWIDQYEALQRADPQRPKPEPWTGYPPAP
jgi:Flp pilus assembly pilin Flp